MCLQPVVVFIEKVKTIILGLDTKIDKIVTIHSAIMSFMLIKQYENKTNTVKPSVHKLNLRTYQRPQTEGYEKDEKIENNALLVLELLNGL